MSIIYLWLGRTNNLESMLNNDPMTDDPTPPPYHSWSIRYVLLSKLAAEFLRLFLFGFKGALGAEELVHRIHHVLHLPGEIWVAFLQLLLLLPQAAGHVHQLGGLVAALAPHLLHVGQKYLHALHQLLQRLHRNIQRRRVHGPCLGAVWSLGLRLAVWLWLHPVCPSLPNQSNGSLEEYGFIQLAAVFEL